MFTGIVAAVGRIQSVQKAAASDGGVRLHVASAGLPLGDVSLGASIAMNGACMTVAALGPDWFEVDVSRESLARTVGLDAPGDINLEKALRMGDELGGHLVSGHVDGVGQVQRLITRAESCELVIRVSPALGAGLAYKGSVAIDGVSLTVNQVTDGLDFCEISINLIPYTLAATTLRRLGPGTSVNVEIDTIARYVGRMLALQIPFAPPA